MISVLNDYEYLGDYDPIMDDVQERIKIANLKVDSFKVWSVQED